MNPTLCRGYSVKGFKVLTLVLHHEKRIQLLVSFVGFSIPLSHRISQFFLDIPEISHVFRCRFTRLYRNVDSTHVVLTIQGVIDSIQHGTGVLLGRGLFLSDRRRRYFRRDWIRLTAFASAIVASAADKEDRRCEG